MRGPYLLNGVCGAIKECVVSVPLQVQIRWSWNTNLRFNSDLSDKVIMLWRPTTLVSPLICIQWLLSITLMWGTVEILLHRILYVVEKWQDCQNLVLSNLQLCFCQISWSITVFLLCFFIHLGSIRTRVCPCSYASHNNIAHEDSVARFRVLSC